MNEDTNAKTLQSYEDNIEAFISGTRQVVEGDVKVWLDKTFNEVPHTARVLELGSGFGRDATYLEALGYEVTCSDAAQGFVDVLRQNGRHAVLLDALTDEIGGPYDVIFANAVLLHFITDEMAAVLRRIHTSLSEHGMLAFSLKRGEGSGWSEHKVGAPRFFQYWHQDDLSLAVEQAGFTIADMWDGTSTNPDKIYAIVHK